VPKDLKSSFFPNALRSILGILHQAPSSFVGEYNSEAMIRTVNALLPFGKEKILVGIAEYLRVAPTSGMDLRRMNQVLFVLFDAPSFPSNYSADWLGKPVDVPPLYRMLSRPSSSRSPMFCVGNVPLLLPTSYLTSGEFDFDAYLQYFRENATIRMRPLNPDTRTLAILTLLMSWKHLLNNVDGSDYAATEAILFDQIRKANSSRPEGDCLFRRSE
jgi:hypothetical protein